MSVPCARCGFVNLGLYSYCSNCGAPAPGAGSPLQPGPIPSANPYADAALHKAYFPPVSPANQGDSTGGLIPYKNPQALIAYYLGLLSGLPLIGFPLGVAALILGIRGLIARKRNPIIKGSVHAGIGIGCGGFFALFWGAMIVFIVVGLATDGFR